MGVRPASSRMSSASSSPMKAGLFFFFFPFFFFFLQHNRRDVRFPLQRQKTKNKAKKYKNEAIQFLHQATPVPCNIEYWVDIAATRPIIRATSRRPGGNIGRSGATSASRPAARDRPARPNGHQAACPMGVDSSGLRLTFLPSSTFQERLQNVQAVKHDDDGSLLVQLDEPKVKQGLIGRAIPPTTRRPPAKGLHAAKSSTSWKDTDNNVASTTKPNNHEPTSDDSLIARPNGPSTRPTKTMRLAGSRSGARPEKLSEL